MTVNNKGGRPEGKYGWDYDALHYMLWMDRTTGDEVRVNINRWAEIYGVSKENIWQVLSRMVDQNRIEKTSTRGIYRVLKPG